jgi:hypothetical protein
MLALRLQCLRAGTGRWPNPNTSGCPEMFGMGHPAEGGPRCLGHSLATVL